MAGAGQEGFKRPVPGKQQSYPENSFFLRAGIGAKDSPLPLPLGAKSGSADGVYLTACRGVKMKEEREGKE